jgi:hypothetical protein
MTRNKALTCLTVLLTLAFGLCRAHALAPAPSFTLSASNITMSSNNTSIPITLTSVNGFTGSVGLTCTPPNPPSGVKEPSCGGGPYQPTVLTANATVTGGLAIYAIKPLPTSSATSSNLPGHGRRTTWTLAGALMLGLGALRKKSQLSKHLLLVVGMFVGLAVINACGGPETLTPGTYSYTLTAAATPGASNPTFSTTTTATVTIPAGIIVLPGPGPI